MSGYNPTRDGYIFGIDGQEIRTNIKSYYEAVQVSYFLSNLGFRTYFLSNIDCLA